MGKLKVLVLATNYGSWGEELQAPWDALKKAGLDPSKHMIAVTSQTSPLAKSSDYLAAFFMDDYIGGRFSSSSAVGGAIL